MILNEMNPINNNAFEVDPSPRNKRKRSQLSDNVYMNPALDLLSTEDPICNTTMEVVPAKRTRRSKSCDDRLMFENPALDTGVTENDIRCILTRELNNVNEKLTSVPEEDSFEYRPSVCIRGSVRSNSSPRRYSTPDVRTYPSRRSVSFDLSFIEKLEVDEDGSSNLYLDDDLNESNIMEIKSIAPVAPKRVMKNTNPFIDCDDDLTSEMSPSISCNDFPFDLPAQKSESSVEVSSDMSIYNDSPTLNVAQPRRLIFNETVQSVNKPTNNLNKQSKILGFDVSNLNTNCAFDNRSLNNFKKTRKPLNILNRLKDVFKHEKRPTKRNAGENPYEVKRPGTVECDKVAYGFENRGLNFADMDVEDKRYIDLSDVEQSINRKHVRFDTTLNHEKLITGSSFEECTDRKVLDEIDTRIDEFHDELENCFNEKKLISQHISS